MIDAIESHWGGRKRKPSMCSPEPTGAQVAPQERSSRVWGGGGGGGSCVILGRWFYVMADWSVGYIICLFLLASVFVFPLLGGVHFHSFSPLALYVVGFLICSLLKRERS